MRIAAFANGDDVALLVICVPFVHGFQISREIALTEAPGPCQGAVDVIAVDELDFEFLNGLAVVVAGVSGSLLVLPCCLEIEPSC
jgi:hypothetical protein